MKRLKYLFLIVAMVFVSITNVNASTQVAGPDEAGIKVVSKSCSSNLLKYEFTNVTYGNGVWSLLDEIDLESTSSVWNASNYFIELTPETKYYFYRYVGGSSVNVVIYYFKEDLTLSTKKTSSQLYDTGSFTTPSDMKYILFTYYSKPSNALTYTSHFMISETEGLSSYVDYQECSVEPDVPDDSEDVILDSTLDDFYDIFNSKLQLLASFAQENKYVFSTIGIVILFSVLGLLFRLLKVGGGR